MGKACPFSSVFLNLFIVFSNRDCISNKCRMLKIVKGYKAYCHLTDPFISRAVSKPRAPSMLYAAPGDLGWETLVGGTYATKSTNRAGGWLIFLCGASNGKGLLCCGQRQSGEGSCEGALRAHIPKSWWSKWPNLTFSPWVNLLSLVSWQSGSSSAKQEFRKESWP